MLKTYLWSSDPAAKNTADAQNVVAINSEVTQNPVEIPPYSVVRLEWSSGISVLVNGKSIVMDVPPVLENGRTLGPLRPIFEALGARVLWNDRTQTVTASKGNTEVALTIGKKEAAVNGKTVLLDAPARLVNDRTLVPVRFVSESLGAQVTWDEQRGAVIIDLAE